MGLHHVLLAQHAFHKQQCLGHVTSASGCSNDLQHMSMPRQPSLPLQEHSSQLGQAEL